MAPDPHTDECDQTHITNLVISDAPLTYGCEIAGYDFELQHGTDHNNQMIHGLCEIIRGLENRIKELEKRNAD